MVKLGYELLVILLETDHISYEEFTRKVPEAYRPREYDTYLHFLKHKGKASKRLAKEAAWDEQAILREAWENWNR